MSWFIGIFGPKHLGYNFIQCNFASRYNNIYYKLNKQDGKRLSGFKLNTAPKIFTFLISVTKWPYMCIKTMTGNKQRVATKGHPCWDHQIDITKHWADLITWLFIIANGKFSYHRFCKCFFSNQIQRRRSTTRLLFSFSYYPKKMWLKYTLYHQVFLHHLNYFASSRRQKRHFARMSWSTKCALNCSMWTCTTRTRKVVKHMFQRRQYKSYEKLLVYIYIYINSRLQKLSWNLQKLTILEGALEKKNYGIIYNNIMLNHTSSSQV